MARINGMSPAPTYAEYMASKRIPVECGTCGWKSRRKPGNFVSCPRCGGIAAFQPITVRTQQQP